MARSTSTTLLNKLHVRDFTKSRPRRSTDNALVESKNAHALRRFLGRAHIPQRFAPLLNAFVRQHLSPFLNDHRPCLLPSQRVYRPAEVCTPYAKFRSLPDATVSLKPGLSFATLDAQAHAMSGLQASRALNAARDPLFLSIDHSPPPLDHFLSLPHPLRYPLSYRDLSQKQFLDYPLEATPPHCLPPPSRRPLHRLSSCWNML